MFTMRSNSARFLSRFSKAAACLLLAVAFGACTSGEREATTNSAGGNTKTAPVTAGKPPAQLPPGIADSVIQSLDGESFRLADYKGKVVVLDLWATWCGPCRLEIPHLVAIGNEYGGRGVEVVGLSTENPQQAAEAVRNFARDFKIDYKLGWANPQVAQLIGFGGGVIPQTLVIGRDGTVVMHHAGFSPCKTPQMLRDAVEKALAQG